MLRRALFAKELALRGLEHALQHFSALRGFRIRHAHPWNFEALLCVPLGIALTDAQSRLRNEAQAPPFEVRAQFKDISHRPQGSAIPFPRNHTLILVLDLGFALMKLPQ